MTQSETWYFSYGSNLSKKQMRTRTGSLPTSVIAKLPGYRLAFGRTADGHAVYANILPEVGSEVLGVAYRCSPYAMDRLDHYEGVDDNCYRREIVRVTAENGQQLDCVVYIGVSFSEKVEYPADDYLSRIVTGAEEHHLPKPYIESITALARPGS